jgi:hypothetical protein
MDLASSNLSYNADQVYQMRSHIRDTLKDNWSTLRTVEHTILP